MENTLEKNKTVRVLVANRPRLMRDLILATITECSDIEVVGEVESEADITRHVEKTQPDCLIITLDQTDTQPSICDSLLRDFPEMKILALSAGHDCSMFFWASTQIHSRSVEPSENGVVNALRESSSKGVTS
jgi:DNA-binding NarL/FixJ family response regulator